MKSRIVWPTEPVSLSSAPALLRLPAYTPATSTLVPYRDWNAARLLTTTTCWPAAEGVDGNVNWTPPEMV